MASFLFFALALPAPAQEGRGQAPPVVKPKSENKAFTLSLVGSLVPWALSVSTVLLADDASNTAKVTMSVLSLSTLLVGPAMGYFYAGLKHRAWSGIGIRALGVAAAVAGTAIAYSEETDSPGLAAALLIGGGIVALYSSVYDVVHVKKAVREQNQKVGGASLNITPIVLPKSKTLGMQVQLSF